MIDEILDYNKFFVENEKYSKYITSKYPAKKLAIVSCMDTRLIELLPSAMGLKNGDAKIIKNAGGIISHPFGSAMRSLLICVYELGVTEILVVGHTDCGARYTDSDSMIQKMLDKGISRESIDMVEYCGVNFKTWLGGFTDLEDSIEKSVESIKKHPLIPESISVYGLVMDSITGKLTKL